MSLTNLTGKKEAKSFYQNSQYVTELTPSDFLLSETWTLANPDSERSAVLFYASWCPHCVAFKDVWESLYRINGCIKLYAFNCAEYDEYYASQRKRSEAVAGFPTIAFYHQNVLKETYQGPRNPPDQLVKAMLLFCQKNQNGKS